MLEGRPSISEIAKDTGKSPTEIVRTLKFLSKPIFVYFKNLNRFAAIHPEVLDKIGAVRGSPGSVFPIYPWRGRRKVLLEDGKEIAVPFPTLASFTHGIDFDIHNFDQMFVSYEAAYLAIVAILGLSGIEEIEGLKSRVAPITFVPEKSVTELAIELKVRPVEILREADKRNLNLAYYFAGSELGRQNEIPRRIDEWAFISKQMLREHAYHFPNGPRIESSFSTLRLGLVQTFVCGETFKLDYRKISIGSYEKLFFSEADTAILINFFQSTQNSESAQRPEGKKICPPSATKFEADQKDARDVKPDIKSSARKLSRRSVISATRKDAVVTMYSQLLQSVQGARTKYIKRTKGEISWSISRLIDDVKNGKIKLEFFQEELQRLNLTKEDLVRPGVKNYFKDRGQILPSLRN